MASKRASWEKKLYRGTAGSTAATQIDEKLVDLTFNAGPEFTDDGDRGDGSALPQGSEMPVKMVVKEFSFSMRYKDGEAHVLACLAASRAGTAIALKVERYASGTVEFDGDAYLEDSSPGGIEDGQTIEFTAHVSTALRAFTIL
jgi:hypothetical protein